MTDKIIPGVLSSKAARMRSQSRELASKIAALLFSVVVASIPILIVAMSPDRSGGIFVSGYLVGVITAPIVALGVLRAASTLFGSSWFNSLVGILIYLALLFLISIAAAMWSLFFLG